MRIKEIIYCFSLLTFVGCDNSNGVNKEKSIPANNNDAGSVSTLPPPSSISPNRIEKNNSENNYQDDNEDDEENLSSSDCGLDDDTYSATVDYTNDNTGYTATYDLDVVVEDCQVVEIDFSNGGYLDDSHIDPADIDDDGNATVEDDQ